MAALERHGVTTLCAPPTVWRMLIQEDMKAYRGRIRLREIIGAGEPLNPEIIDQVREAWGLTLRDGFGQTETTAQVGNAPGQTVKPGSMGRPLPGYQVVLLDADGKECEEGEVCLKLDPRPAGLMTCYEDSPEKTAAVMCVASSSFRSFRRRSRENCGVSTCADLKTNGESAERATRESSSTKISLD
jgi:acetyl-CoA synthetase